MVSKLLLFVAGLLGAILPAAAMADSYFYGVLDTVTVPDGTVSQDVSVYYHNDTAFDGLLIAYVELNVQSGNGTLKSASNNPGYGGSADVSTGPTPPAGSFGEILDIGSLGPAFAPTNDILLGTFNLIMPLGGTTTIVSLDGDSSSPVVTDVAGNPNADLSTASGTVTFNPSTGTVPLPAAVWGGLSLLLALGATTFRRRPAM
jgi:hypothetical protein